MHSADGIGILGRTFCRDVHQIRTVHLEYLAQHFHFGFVLRTELLDEADAVVPVNSLGHERRQGSALAIVVDDAFLYIGTLFLEFLENFSLSDFGIEGQQLVYKCFYPVKALFGSSKVQQFFYGKDSGPMNDRLVGMVNQHVAVGLVFLAEEDHIHAEALLHFLLQFFLVGAYVPVFFQIGSQLSVARLVLITFLI